MHFTTYHWSGSFAKGSACFIESKPKKVRIILDRILCFHKTRKVIVHYIFRKLILAWALSP